MNDMVEQYNKHGYAVIPHAIESSLIVKAFQQFERLLNEAIANMGTNPESIKGVDNKYLWLKNSHPAMKSHVYDLMKYLDTVRSIANTEIIVNAIKSIIGDPVLVDNILIRIDDPTNDRQRPLHQEGLGQISYNSVNLWIPLIDVNENTGTMCFHPDSHHPGYVRHRFYPEFGNYHGISEEFMPAEKPQLATLRKGDALLFHPCLFHGSAPMKNYNGLRWTLIGRYNDIANAPYIQHEDQPLHTTQTESDIKV